MTLKSLLGWFDKGDDPKKSQEETDWTEKRGGQRIDLEHDRALVVNLQVPTGGDVAAVLQARIRNVSVRGCRLVMDSPSDRSRLYMAQIILAAIDVESFSIPLQMEVVRLIGEREAAVRFKPPYPRELDRLEKFLEPRSLGRSLREIDPAALQKTNESGKALRWFQGINESSLFAWVGPSGDVTQQQLIFLDRVVEWRGDERARTGRVKVENAGTAPGWVKADLLEFDETRDLVLLGQAKTMIESSRIDPEIRNAFLRKL